MWIQPLVNALIFTLFDHKTIVRKYYAIKINPIYRKNYHVNIYLFEASVIITG